MAQVTFGTFQEFQPNSETITAYLERANNYFAANGVGADRQVAVLLSAISAKHYTLLRSLTAPQLPYEKSIGNLASVLQSHFQPKPLLIAERFHFHRCNQAPDESIAESHYRPQATHSHPPMASERLFHISCLMAVNAR